MLSQAERNFIKLGRGKKTEILLSNYIYVLTFRIKKKIDKAIEDLLLILDEIYEGEDAEEYAKMLENLREILKDSIDIYAKQLRWGFQ